MLFHPFNKLYLCDNITAQSKYYKIFYISFIFPARSRRPHFTKMVMFDNPDVPMEPHPQALRKVKRKSNVFEVYKKVSQVIYFIVRMKEF